MSYGESVWNNNSFLECLIMSFAFSAIDVNCEAHSVASSKRVCVIDGCVLNTNLFHRKQKQYQPDNLTVTKQNQTHIHKNKFEKAYHPDKMTITKLCLFLCPGARLLQLFRVSGRSILNPEPTWGFIYKIVPLNHL